VSEVGASGEAGSVWRWASTRIVHRGHLAQDDLSAVPSHAGFVQLAAGCRRDSWGWHVPCPREGRGQPAPVDGCEQDAGYSRSWSCAAQMLQCALHRLRSCSALRLAAMSICSGLVQNVVGVLHPSACGHL
jgi:hypothetical protein